MPTPDCQPHQFKPQTCGAFGSAMFVGFAVSLFRCHRRRRLQERRPEGPPFEWGGCCSSAIFARQLVSGAGLSCVAFKGLAACQ